MNNLSTNVLKQLSKMAKGTRFLKNLFQKTKFFMKLCPIRTNFETKISKSVNYTKFVYCWQETFKMGVPTAKSGLPINSCYKFPFSQDTSISRNGSFPFFSCSKEKNMFGCEEIKNVINISSVKNWFKLLWALFKSFDFIK